MPGDERPGVDRRTFLRWTATVAAGGVLAACSDGGSQKSGDATPPASTSEGGGVDGPGAATTAFMDALWDEQLGLIRFPFEQGPPPVRETAWYALGLLQRDGPGDRERARRALESVVARQYDSPGAIFHGSYARTANDPLLPPPDAVEFAQFDPNWRQFIGTVLVFAAAHYGRELGSARAELERSAELAAMGERVDRVQPDYSNIALMHAWLLASTGQRRQGEELATAVADRYRAAGALDEYNSPTYDGIALYALALWRSDPPSARFAELGDEIWAGVWQDLAGTYHAGLRNISGPYSRAYGMDLSAYSSPTGLWIWSVVGRDRAPFPDLGAPFEHPGDVCFGPLVELFPTDVPDKARPHFDEFQKERLVRVGVRGARESTSWLSKRVMLGGHSGPAVRVGGQQIHPATVHWESGWIRVRGPLDAVARAGALEFNVRPEGPARVTIRAAGTDPATVGPTRWELPGLAVTVTSDAPPAVAPHATEEGVETEYPAGRVQLEVAAG
jgi:hypothetical protein